MIPKRTVRSALAGAPPLPPFSYKYIDQFLFSTRRERHSDSFKYDKENITGRERAEKGSNVFRVREEDTFLIIERAIRSGDVKIRETRLRIFFFRPAVNDERQ